ncbi:MAG: BREX-3 system P-loop-containing protein BrxF [Desulfobacula sp.]|mgnify:FL=1|jgi:hypothetical protein|uniref:BREX-3 system P-loop-containing protein BrxF n=1 Tax=Desulfobacula sp. TaxID=2593537 RepID=UPI001EB2F1D5|nr:BREX-3 system P-loop-containing protein BrxF [Desulfobacula sp.]
MVKTTIEKLMESINEAKDLYHSLVLLVGPSDIRKETAINEIAEKLDQQPINLNLELSKCLLEMTNKKRALKVAEKLDEVIAPFQEYSILDFTEILFDVNLKQDPLALLKKLSRNKTIIASWNGIIKNKKLTYAEPRHPEYRAYDTSDIQIIEMEKDS